MTFDSKKYSKFIYLLLTVLFVYNSFGYLLLYFPARTIIKHIVQKSINEKKINPEELSVLVFNITDLAEKKYDFVWKKPGKEFRFNGKMYDIEDKVVKDDTVYYNCYYDHKENILEEIFTLQFDNDKKDKSQNSKSRIILLGLFSEEVKSLYLNLQDRTQAGIPLQKTEFELLNPFIDVLTPPPRNLV